MFRRYRSANEARRGEGMEHHGARIQGEEGNGGEVVNGMCARGIVTTCKLPEKLAASERQVKRQADRIREMEKRDEKPVKTEAEPDVLRGVLDVARECINDAEEAYADAPAREISAYLRMASSYLGLALSVMKK
jgi:hypothetical protein